MKIRFYVAPQQGTGTYLDPYRSILNDLIDIYQGEKFDEIDNPVRKISICCVHALDATHAKIASDSRVISIGDIFEEKDGTLDKSISDISLRTRLETIGIAIKDSDKLRNILSSIMREFSIEQIKQGQGKTVDKNSIGKLKMSGEEF